MSQRRPPLASHGNLGGGDAAPPPRSGTPRSRGALRADFSALSSSSPSPQTHTSDPRSGRVCPGVESSQVRGPGFPAILGAPPTFLGEAGAGEMREWPWGIDPTILPRVHLDAGESSGRGWGCRVPRASFLSSLPCGPEPAEVGGGTHRARRLLPPPPRFPGLCCRCARAPRLPHCGSRGPINRESDVLRSREWREPGSWGRGRAEPQAPAPPPPSHVSWLLAPTSRHVRRVSAPWGHVGRVSRSRLLGGHVRECWWDTCSGLL